MAAVDWGLLRGGQEGAAGRQSRIRFEFTAGQGGRPPDWPGPNRTFRRSRGDTLDKGGRYAVAERW